MEAALGFEAVADGRLVFASGTFTANPIATAAALAVMDVIEAEDPAPRLDDLARRLRAGLTARFAAHRVPAWAIGAASITQVHFSESPPQDRRDVVRGDHRRTERFLLGMLGEGILWTPVHSALTCTAHTADDIDRVIEAADRVAMLFSGGPD
jgi:glutamate-1-semialdehyde 2,1-aminomutase